MAASVLDLLDETVLKVYHQFPKEIRKTLETFNEEIIAPDADVGDEEVLRTHCYVLKGTLRQVLESLQPDMVVLAIELPRADAKGVAAVLEAVLDKCKKLRVLKIAKNGHTPARPTKKVEKRIVKVFRRMAQVCTDLSYLDLRDILVTRNLYDILAEIPNLSKLSINGDWNNLEAMSSCKADQLLFKLIMHPKIDLFDFKGYGKYRGPDEKTVYEFVRGKAEAIVGLSAALTSSKVGWLFRCRGLKYLDLDIKDPDLLSKTASGGTWSCLDHLTHLKLSSSNLVGFPPLKNCNHLKNLILDVTIPEEWDLTRTVEERLPAESLEFAMFPKLGKGRMDMIFAFRSMEELKTLYFGFAENGKPQIGTASYPPNLETLVVLKDNGPDTECTHYDAAAANIQQSIPGLKLKVNGFESPLSSVLWPSMCRRFAYLLNNPLVFDWSVPCFMDKMYKPTELCGTGAEECPCVPAKK